MWHSHLKMKLTILHFLMYWSTRSTRSTGVRGFTNSQLRVHTRDGRPPYDSMHRRRPSPLLWTVPGTSINYIYRQVYFRIIAGLVENGLFSPYPFTKIGQSLMSRSVENAKRDGYCGYFELTRPCSAMALAEKFVNFSVVSPCHFEIKLFILWRCQNRERAVAVHLCLQQIMLEQGHQFPTLLKMQWNWYVTHLKRHLQNRHREMEKSRSDIWVSLCWNHNINVQYLHANQTTVQ